MKRVVIILTAFLLSLTVTAQTDSRTPQYVTYNYLLSLMGIYGVDEADEAVLQRLSAYEFRTPDATVNAKGGLLSVAVIQQGGVPQEYADLLSHFFGIQPQPAAGQLVIQPSFPADWDSCYVHTPDIDYAFRRDGLLLTYQVTQRSQRPLTVVVRQEAGMGRYVEVKGNRDAQQTLQFRRPSLLPEVTLASGYDDSHLQAPGMAEPNFDRRFKTQNLEKFFTREVSHSLVEEYIMEKEYVVEGVPFLLPKEGLNAAVVHYPDTLSVPLNTKAECLWLLLTGNSISRDVHQSKALIVAHYQDGTADILPLINPDNWGNIREGSSVRRCLPLNPDKKVMTLDIRPLVADVGVALLGLTLQ